MNLHHIIQIKKSSQETYWYAKNIGEMFHASEVNKSNVRRDKNSVLGDFEVITFPEPETTRHFVCQGDAKIIATFTDKIKVGDSKPHVPLNVSF